MGVPIVVDCLFLFLSSYLNPKTLGYSAMNSIYGNVTHFTKREMLLTRRAPVCKYVYRCWKNTQWYWIVNAQNRNPTLNEIHFTRASSGITYCVLNEMSTYFVTLSHCTTQFQKQVDFLLDRTHGQYTMGHYPFLRSNPIFMHLRFHDTAINFIYSF